jgi:uncharacterized protein (TIGR02118 family)
MRLTIVAFNFQNDNLAAEEENYRERHVALVRTVPGLRLYLTGKLRATPHFEPDRYRVAALAFDDAAAAARAFASGTVTKALAADTEAHLTAIRRYAADAEWIVPFASSRPGRDCFVMAAAFNFKLPDQKMAEEHYLGYHVPLAKRLPGLRGYAIGKTVAERGAAADRYRVALLVFDNYEGMVEAYRSPVGGELSKDEQYLIGDPIAHFFDARVEV